MYIFVIYMCVYVYIYIQKYIYIGYNHRPVQYHHHHHFPNGSLVHWKYVIKIYQGGNASNNILNGIYNQLSKKEHINQQIKAIPLACCNAPLQYIKLQNRIQSFKPSSSEVSELSLALPFVPNLNPSISNET